MSSLTVERVTHKLNPNHSTNTSFYIPQITTLTAPRPPNASTYKSNATSNPFEEEDEDGANKRMEVEMSTSNQSSTETSHDFDTGDLARVMDFDNLPDPPPNSNLLLSLEDFQGKDDGAFPARYVCLRGSYLFFLDASNRNNSKSSNMTMQSLPPPLGCIPLARTVVEIPEGGRRAFREHAFTPAKNGYEFVISHTGDESKNAQHQQPSIHRPRVFVVAESLSHRDDWANAIRLRAEIRKRDTGLRPRAVGTVNANEMESETASLHRKGNQKVLKKTGTLSRRMSQGGTMEGEDTLSGTSASSVSGIDKNVVVNEPFLRDALQRFGVTDFNEKNWVYKFYEQNNEFDAPKQVRKLEDYQKAVKQGVRGAVLEQYKYFVEASREMTVMGKEVQSLKTLVDGQVRLIDQLKSIEFADVFRQETNTGSDSSDDEGNFKTYQDEEDDDVSLSSVESSESESNGLQKRKNPNIKRKPVKPNPIFQMSRDENDGSSANIDGAEDGANAFEIPPWLSDVTEDISAFIKECRYTNATDLILKAKIELADIFNQHEKLTDRRLSKKQLYTTNQTSDAITELTKRMAGRLTEALRRKNEAFRQLSKRERADPLSELAPLLSPICLHDDDNSLQLLVKLGFTNDAAGAYAARRSLLLMETLNERPISSEIRLDVVINAAQLCQSFFSCLAMAVEGFLDLFIMGSGSMTNGIKSTMDDTSIQSSPNSKVPPGALASIVLWCDSELMKFSSTFGTKILGQLNLFHQRINMSGSGNLPKIRTPEELGEYAAAEKLKQKLASADDDDLVKSGGKGSDSRRDKERKKSIDLAAQCIDRAFHFASENLDSIGLPLTPRLAGCLRAKLKGSEAEVAKMLQKRWGHFVFDWFAPSNMDESGKGSSINNQWRRSNKSNTSMKSPNDL